MRFLSSLRALGAALVASVAFAPAPPPPPSTDPAKPAPAVVSQRVNPQWRPYYGPVTWWGYQAERRPHLGERQRVNLYRSRGGGKRRGR